MSSDIPTDVSESHVLAQALLNAPDDYVVILDRNGTILYANEAVKRRSPPHIEDLIGCGARDIYPPHIAEPRMANLEAAFTSGQVVRFEDENAGRCFDHVLHPVTGANGNCEKVIAIARDITDRKLMEEAFRESEERYRSIFENSLDAILVTDREGGILEANSAAYEIFGCSRQEVCGSGMDLLCDATDSESQKLLTGLSSGAKMNREVTQVRKDGSSFSAEISSASFKNRQGEEQNILVLRDISERKQSEDALRRAKLELETRVQERTIGLIKANEGLAKSEEKYRQLVEHAPAGILEVDLVRNRRVSLELAQAAAEEKGNSGSSQPGTGGLFLYYLPRPTGAIKKDTNPFRSHGRQICGGA